MSFSTQNMMISMGKKYNLNVRKERNGLFLSLKIPASYIAIKIKDSPFKVQ